MLCEMASQGGYQRECDQRPEQFRSLNQKTFFANTRYVWAQQGEGSGGTVGAPEENRDIDNARGEGKGLMSGPEVRDLSCKE